MPLDSLGRKREEYSNVMEEQGKEEALVTYTGLMFSSRFLRSPFGMYSSIIII